MFPDYVPPEDLAELLREATLVAADIDPEKRRVEVCIHSERYLSSRKLQTVADEITGLYGLGGMQITATHPADQRYCMEPEDIMQLFVEQTSMARGSLAGAKYSWQEDTLQIALKANGKHDLQKAVPVVTRALQERFGAPVQIQIEAGQDLTGELRRIENFGRMYNYRCNFQFSDGYFDCRNLP